MKKVILFLLIITCMFTLFACKDEEKDKDKDKTEEPPVVEDGNFEEDLSIHDFIF